LNIPPERVLAASEATSKKAMLTEMAGLFSSMDSDQVLESIMAREKLGSTGIGHGVAIPHCRIPELTETRLALARHVEGVDFDAIDGLPVHIVIMLLVPDDEDRKHLQTLAALARSLQDKLFRQSIMGAGNAEELSDLFKSIVELKMPFSAS